jgi:hypothetical protein
MRLYLGGPMRGIPLFNFPAFHQAASELRTQGHEVFSPAERDNEYHGTDISAGNLAGDESQAHKEHGFDLREAMLRDCSYICLHAEGIALLPGWENSKGARAEKALGEALGLDIIYLGKR